MTTMLEDTRTQDAANDLADRYRWEHRATAPGMYRDGQGVVWRVKHNRDKTGLYAQRVIAGEGRVRFEYVHGAIARLLSTHQMTLEEGREYARLIGACCVCGRTLTDPTSVGDGIGPICRKQFRPREA
jgi:hypothetical protein